MKVNSDGAKELVKAEAQLNSFTNSVKTAVESRDLPTHETEKQTQLSSNDLRKATDIYLKPSRTLPDRQKFNERFRDDWNRDKEYVQFIAEHKELVGSHIECWTHRYGGTPCEFWEVPTNKPVWGPRYLAEQISRKNYHRLVMDESKVVSSDGMSTQYGVMAANSMIQRLDAYPVKHAVSKFGVRGF